MDEDEDGEEDKGDDNDNDDEDEDANKKMSVSLEDLKDALNDDVATTTTDNDSESDFKECSSGGYGANGDELRCGTNDRGRMRGQIGEISGILHWNFPLSNTGYGDNMAPLLGDCLN